MNCIAFERSLATVAKKAEFEARRLIGLGWFRTDEQDDLQQDLLLHWWKKRKAIPTDGGTGSAYGAAVLRNKGLDLVRHEYAPVRDRRRSGSLPEEVFADDRQPILPRALITEPLDDDRIDVYRLLERLSPAKRRFAWLLAEHGLIAAADEIGISRSTASRWKREIGALLAAQGLGRERRKGARRT